MDFQTLRREARERFKGACRVCPVCDGRACAGEVPGMGGLGTGAAFRNNISALSNRLFNMSTVHEVREPVSACRFLGMDLALPVLGAPMGGVSFNMNAAVADADFATALVEGCSKAGTVAMTPDSPCPADFESGIAALRAGRRVIPVIKPRATDKVIELARQAADAGAPAFGMDIDAAALVNMSRAGHPVGPKTREDLARIKQSVSIPFMVKGVMTRSDAATCLEAGVDAIVVSNHGGRALDHVPGTADVLPEIADAVKERMAILVDGGIRSGADVLKMLALGADAVLLGRPLAVAAVGGLAEGVEMTLGKLADELRAAMVLTGTPDVSLVSRRILHA
ncbi:MAG: alpha-hydroxy-acid oxidizing protein [Acidobacteriota bacterium]